MREAIGGNVPPKAPTWTNRAASISLNGQPGRCGRLLGMPNRARSVATVLAVAGVGLSSGCGADRSVRDEPDCAPATSYRGEPLMGTVLRLTRPLPTAVRRHQVPAGCGLARRTQTLLERRGIPPTVALFAASSGGQTSQGTAFFMARDSFPALASHPLHRYLYGSPTSPNTTRGRRCRTVHVESGIGFVTGQRISVRLGARSRAVVFEAASRLRGPRRDGVVRLRKGLRIAGTALRCGTRQILVAKDLTAR